MNRFLLILLLVLVWVNNCFARDTRAARNNSLLARVTVYWAHGGRGADRYTRQHKSATGTRLHVGHCAVDPKKIPYGSRVVLPDGTALAAVDTGSAVRNRKAARRAGRTSDERNAIVIDKFFETKGQAVAWANTNPPFVNVKVVPPNAPVVSTPNITSAQPIALSSPAPTAAPVPAAPAIASAGSAVKNPLGRLGR